MGEWLHTCCPAWLVSKPDKQRNRLPLLQNTEFLPCFEQPIDFVALVELNIFVVGFLGFI